MKTSSQRRVAFAALLLAPALAACGFNAQTDKVYQASTGINNRDGQVDVLNALVVSGEDGSGTFIASLVNKSDTETDTLSSVTGDGVEVNSGKGVEVRPGTLVNLAESGKISVTGDGVVPGKFVTVTLAFDNGQSTTMRVPVEVHAGDYADVPLPKSTPSSDTTPAE